MTAPILLSFILNRKSQTIVYYRLRRWYILKKPTSYLAHRLRLSGGTVKFTDDAHHMRHVDVIFGCDILGQILRGDKVDLGGGLCAISTIFDYAIFGPSRSVCSYDLEVNNNNNVGLTLLEAVERFWRSEEPPSAAVKNPADLECENMFTATTSRGADGKYIVRLPLTPDHPRLGDSSETALRRFLAIERRMKRQPDYRAKYVEFMSEYLNLGHMAVSNFDVESGEEHYFLPHHGVFKKSGDTEKIRIVFDGSVQTSTAVSLNDCLFSGPRLQNDITQIINNCPDYGMSRLILEFWMRTSI